MIKNNHIRIRPLKETELEAMVSALNTLEYKGAYLPLSFANLVQMRKQYLENGLIGPDSGRMVIEELATGRLVGEIAYFKPAHYCSGFELGYGIYEDRDKGCGFCSEAVMLMSEWLFSTREINRLQICMDTRNKGSERVAEKCGFVFEGVLRGFLFSRGAYRDICIYGMTREVFEQITPRSCKE